MFDFDRSYLKLIQTLSRWLHELPDIATSCCQKASDAPFDRLLRDELGFLPKVRIGRPVNQPVGKLRGELRQDSTTIRVWSKIYANDRYEKNGRAETLGGALDQFPQTHCGLRRLHLGCVGN